MKSESGNIIWFLLVAIALMAALTVVMTRSSDTAGQSGDRELLRIQASQILRTAKGWEQAIGRMSVQEVSADDVSFDTAGMTGYANPNCASDSCSLFKAAGGGQAYEAPDTAWLDAANSAAGFYGSWIVTGKLCVQGIGNQSEAIGTDCSSNNDPSDEDLVLLLPYVRKNLCIELNRQAGIGTPGAAPPADTGDTWAASPQFTGGFADGANIGVGNASLYRKSSGCIEGAGTPASGTYTFYHVLVAR